MAVTASINNVLVPLGGDLTTREMSETDKIDGQFSGVTNPNEQRLREIWVSFRLRSRCPHPEESRKNTQSRSTYVLYRPVSQKSPYEAPSSLHTNSWDAEGASSKQLG